jgi:hypothetical protein
MSSGAWGGDGGKLLIVDTLENQMLGYYRV